MKSLRLSSRNFHGISMFFTHHGLLVGHAHMHSRTSKKVELIAKASFCTFVR